MNSSEIIVKKMMILIYIFLLMVGFSRKLNNGMINTDINM